jgi:hypothetical protein
VLQETRTGYRERGGEQGCRVSKGILWLFLCGLTSDSRRKPAETRDLAVKRPQLLPLQQAARSHGIRRTPATVDATSAIKVSSPCW